MQRQDFTYELPEELIARFPCTRRRDSRLLHLPCDGPHADAQFAALPTLLKSGDLLVFNQSKVVPARAYGNKSSGGRVEILLERIISQNQALVKIRASKSPKAGSTLVLDGSCSVTVTGRQEDLFVLQFDADPMAYFDRHGEVPLPPYIDRDPEDLDINRYQTVYARIPGSVAAPTAGLHFDDDMLAELTHKGIDHEFVTLHVGSGTYQPVRCDRIEDHLMHSEYIDVSAALVEKVLQTKKSGGRVIAVGTTSMRSLETASQTGTLQPWSGDTDIFIYPGYRFNVVDMLLTNFHLPESTLLMLVSAFAGRGRILDAYQHAIEQKYRFFSYGDCMLIEQHPDGKNSL